jgi:hypothetical protein
MQSQIMGSATNQDPLSTIALLATAELQEYLEGIRLSFQPHDEVFANTIHEELYHELQALPQTWETPLQGIMKMSLAATTFANSARLDLHTMQLAEGLPDPMKRNTPLPKPRKESQDSSSLQDSPTTQEALLPKNKKSAEPETVEKTIPTSLGAQVATTTMTATTGNENPPNKAWKEGLLLSRLPSVAAIEGLESLIPSVGTPTVAERLSISFSLCSAVQSSEAFCSVKIGVGILSSKSSDSTSGKVHGTESVSSGATLQDGALHRPLLTRLLSTFEKDSRL